MIQKIETKEKSEIVEFFNFNDQDQSRATHYACEAGGDPLKFAVSGRVTDEIIQEAAEKYTEGDGWYDDDKTEWAVISVWEIGRDGGDDEHVGEHRITHHPTAPRCEEADDHEWIATHDIEGGLRENPGVQGHGGGVIIEDHCGHCGITRTRDTWAQDTATGEQGLETIEYGQVHPDFDLHDEDQYGHTDEA